jgi:hypothetical protein
VGLNSVKVPKIDWSDDDYPRWEPRYRPSRRDRLSRPPRPVFPPSMGDTLPLILRQPLLDQDIVPPRRPLHLIWGEPNRAEPSP